ncbi:DUF6168 family protein [Arenibacter latericius]|uniref:DUF6168 family protein n=1 Tax=Arenibacter latericius TaxID=86104 RepID=UPI00040C2F1F|nr:DUF6168 family protein [Arenibacter latericius]MDX1364415.1 DUF6168 family protein [Arenibacter latericius]
MFKKNLLYSFYFSIVLFSLLAFGLHLLVLYSKGLPLFNHMIILAYASNIILTILIFSILYILRTALKHQLGFLFLAGSMLKFVLFFIVFYPVYNMDGNMEPIEFSTFFVPYSVGLIVETFFAAKMLNSLP